MEMFSPVVLRCAMLLEELGEDSLRAAYMVISRLHDLEHRDAR